MNTNAIDQIYKNLNKLIENYDDLPETTDAENSFWEYVHQNISKNIEFNTLDFENALYNVAYFHQRQGFIYGFQYAIDLLLK